MKKKLLICALIAVCLSIVAYSTTAFFTYEDTATNVITMGNIKMELQELAIPDDGGDPVPFQGALNVLPGMDASMIVQIKNVGVQSAWIRISVEKAIMLAEGIEGDADLSLVTFNLNTEKWMAKDGFYYYLEALEPGNTTEPLFTEVSFDPSMNNLYQQSKVFLTVNAQATQVVHNGGTVFEAAGWPNAE